MHGSREFPQIGLIDVDPDALAQPGVELNELLRGLGATLHPESVEDVPLRGWRVLRQEASGAAHIGAPVDQKGRTWRVGYIAGGGSDGAKRSATVHEEVFPLRPSRAERARGLELRWPAVVASDPETPRYVIDIVNMGEWRWHLDSADPFHVVGHLTAPGDDVHSFAFGWAGESGMAVPLDPGEYARVPVHLQSVDWHDLAPGEYELHAWLLPLGLTSDALGVRLTTERLAEERQRSRTRGARPAERRHNLERRLMQLQGATDARRVLPELAAAIVGAASDDEVREWVTDALGCDDATAELILSHPLREFRDGTDLQSQIDQVERMLRAL